MDMMHPFLILGLLIGVPLLFILVMFGPVYAGICGAAYFYYGPEMQAYFYHPAYMIELYESMVDVWQTSEVPLGFSDFILPVFGPLLAGCLVGCWLFYLLIRYIRNIFHV